ncbi:MAG: hypothetical protein AAGA56_08495 [Myxococcota bacterium]
MNRRRRVTEIGLGLALVACRPSPPAPTCEAREPSPTLDRAGPIAHAHNDYEHARPLEDALTHGFTSVEADVYFVDGEVVVSHLGWPIRGTLEALYLAPLQRRFEQGELSRPFSLWVDLKDSSPEMLVALRASLWTHSMLVREDSPVALVLTGDGAKATWTEGLPPRARHRDANEIGDDDARDDPYWTHYALDYRRYFTWDGAGEVPADLQQSLRCLVHRAHERGRRLRLFATPETPSFWRLAMQEGVDFLHVDDFAAYARFSRKKP